MQGKGLCGWHYAGGLRSYYKCRYRMQCYRVGDVLILTAVLMFCFLQAISYHGGWRTTAQLLGLSCVRPAADPAISTPQGLAQQILDFMIQNPPPADSSATQKSSNKQQQGHDAKGTYGQQQHQHQWGRLPTQRELAAAGRPDLMIWLQRHGHEPIRELLGLPQTRKQLKKVGRFSLASFAVCLHAMLVCFVSTAACGFLCGVYVLQAMHRVVEPSLWQYWWLLMYSRHCLLLQARCQYTGLCSIDSSCCIERICRSLTITRCGLRSGEPCVLTLYCCRVSCCGETWSQLSELVATLLLRYCSTSQ